MTTVESACTVHAGRIIGANDRKSLEKLLAYGARGAFSHQRLSLKDQADENGDLIYTLKTQWSDGTEAILVTPSELIEKLIALIPPPYIHMSRYFGVLSSHSKWRGKIILKPHVKKGFVATGVGTGTTRITSLHGLSCFSASSRSTSTAARSAGKSSDRNHAK